MNILFLNKSDIDVFLGLYFYYHFEYKTNEYEVWLIPILELISNKEFLDLKFSIFDVLTLMFQILL